MSAGIEFEKMILDHLRESKHMNMASKTNHAPPTVKSSTFKHSLLPESTILFFGICIGTGLATHALLTNWNVK